MSQGKLCHMPFSAGSLRAQYSHFTCFQCREPWLSPYSDQLVGPQLFATKTLIVCQKSATKALGHLGHLLWGSQVARPMTFRVRVGGHGASLISAAAYLLSLDDDSQPHCKPNSYILSKCETKKQSGSNRYRMTRNRCRVPSCKHTNFCSRNGIE
jgi:hypothetical protein